MLSTQPGQDDTQSFRFLDLPLEIQHEIFRKYFEGDNILRGEKAIRGAISWYGGSNVNLLMVCQKIGCQVQSFYRDAFRSLDVSALDNVRQKKWLTAPERAWLFEKVVKLIDRDHPYAFDFDFPGEQWTVFELKMPRLEQVNILIEGNMYFTDVGGTTQGSAEESLRDNPAGAIDDQQEVEGLVQYHTHLSMLKDLELEVVIEHEFRYTSDYGPARYKEIWNVDYRYRVDFDGDKVEHSLVDARATKAATLLHRLVLARFSAVIGQLKQLRGYRVDDIRPEKTALLDQSEFESGIDTVTS
ncbi:hypothetical protein PMZ80_002110 [Knufia obscura]|uniref:Uncharacterized protein n=1 Tax=Knufia obscura TaxID=1635080 RepID=A0ABR0RWD3_9EURO|nr:hypothetical protein PMZ80_002110 [Knufia obscura]